MQRWFTANFTSERDHDAFLAWLPAWEKDNASADARIRFCRVPDLFSVWTLHCSDEHFEALFNAVGAFNGHAFE